MPQTVFITGASTGIGKATAELFFERGWNVVATMRTPSKNGEGERSDPHWLVTKLDVTVPASIQEALSEARQRFGKIDVLVNNAGVNAIFKGIERTSLEEWQTIIDVNLTGVFLCCKHIGGAMGQGGSVINVSSVAGHTGLLRSVPYCASKGGVEMLTKALALDWASKGIRVNTLAPGWVDTDLTHGLLEHDVHGQRLRSRTPLGRFAAPGDMAGGVVFLASDASSYMTGQSLVIDGGWTAG